MASIRFTDVQSCPTEFLDLTSLTLDEFKQLVSPFEAAFQAHMVTPLEEESAPVIAVPAVAPVSPLWPMTGRNGASSAPKTLLNRPRVRAARKKTTR